MSYEVFKKKVNALIKRAGGKIKVKFSRDNGKGCHYANCSDGTVIIGNAKCLKVTVRWGSGHAGIVTI